MNFINAHRRAIILAALFAGIFFIFGFYERYYWPKIKQWLLVTIESESQKKSPVRVWPQNLEVQFLPLGIRLYDVRLLPQNGLESTLAATTISELDVSLSTWGLIRGQLKIGLAKIKGADFNLILRQGTLNSVPGGATANDNGQQMPKLPAQFSLDTIYQLPIDAIEIEKVKFAVKDEERQIALQSDELNVLIENKSRSIRGDIHARSLKFKKTGNNPIFETDVETNFLFDEDGIYFSELRLRHGQAFFEGTGSIRGALLKGQVADVRARLKTDENLEEISVLARDWFRVKNFPQLKGELTAETEFEFKPPKTLAASFSVKAQDLKIQQFNIGHVEAAGKVDEKMAHLTKASLTHNYGEIIAEKGSFDFDDSGTFKADLTSRALDLNNLLLALGLKETPVLTKIDGHFSCKGESKKQFRINCEGSAATPNLKVTLQKEKPFNIVDLDKVLAEGNVAIDTKAISYKSKLNIGESRGSSEGTITYNNGFKINYEATTLNFADVKNLVYLKPEGTAQIKGSTEGNTKYATIDMNVEGDKFWLKDFGIGHAKFNMKYKAGHLGFSAIEGLFNTSRFKADVSLDLPNSRITVVGSSPYLEANDLLQIFSRKVTLPFSMTGTGSAQIKVSGPLEFSRLSYDLSSSLFRGAIADESYDQINFNISSKDGNVETRKVGLVKGKSTINVTGNIKPTGQMGLKVESHNLQIEQSENLSRLKLNLTGNLSFDSSLTGHILKPQISVNGKLTQMIVGDQPAPDSDFHFNLVDKEFSGGGQLMGGRLKGDFNIPTSNEGVAKVHGQINKWNLAQAFSIFSDSLKASNYSTSVTGAFDIDYPVKNWHYFSGRMQIDELFLKNGRAEMRAPKPITVTATKGLIQAHDFEVNGENTFLRLRSAAQTPGQLGLSLEGRIDLALLTLLTPFLDDLRGQTQFSLNLTGPIEHPSFGGTSYIQDGLIKLKGFPHAFEQLNGDSSFSNDKIVINALKGRLGGGVFYASGNIKLSGMTNVPVDVRGNFSDCKFNVPDGFNTRGSGEFFVKGNWLPYTVGVNFDIDSGRIEPRASSTNKNVAEVKPSTFLPKFLSAQRFSPIELLLNLNIPNELPVRMIVSPVDIRSKVTGRLKVAGPPESPRLSGHISVARGGQVTFRSNIFEVQTGLLDWDNSDPINPNLNVTADAKATATLVNNEIREYNVHMRVTGEAKAPKISMTSEPPLAENDLVSLMTLGFINDQQNNQLQQNQAGGGGLSDNSYQIGGAILNQQLGINRQLEDKLGVQFDYSSNYNQVDQATHHKFTLRKQWTPSFGTSASRDVGKTSTSDVKAEYKLNRRLSVIGEWEGQDSSGTSTTSTTQKSSDNIFGLDLEYKMDFK